MQQSASAVEGGVFCVSANRGRGVPYWYEALGSRVRFQADIILVEGYVVVGSGH